MSRMETCIVERQPFVSYSNRCDWFEKRAKFGGDVCQHKKIGTVVGQWFWWAGDMIGSYLGGNLYLINGLVPCAGSLTNQSEIMGQLVQHVEKEEGLDIQDQTYFEANINLVNGLMCNV